MYFYIFLYNRGYQIRVHAFLEDVMSPSTEYTHPQMQGNWGHQHKFVFVLHAELLFVKVDMFYTANVFPVMSEKRKVDMKREETWMMWHTKQQKVRQLMLMINVII